MARQRSRFSRSQSNVYYTAANIARNCRRGLGLRFQLYSKQHVANPKHIKASAFLVNTCLKSLHMIDALMKDSGLSSKIRNHDTWLVRMLVTEIVFGRKSFNVFDRVSKIVYGFKNQIRCLGKERIQIDKALAFHPQYLRVSKDTSMEAVKNFLAYYNFEEVHPLTILTRHEYMQLVRNLTEKQYVEDRDMSALLVFNPKATKKLAELQSSNKGKFFLQDKASCLVAPILSPTPGSIVLDMCAAPGMKTLHLCSFMKNFGQVVAVDKSSRRLNFLREIVQLKRLTNVTVLDQDAFSDDYTDRYTKKSFTHILLDPPCSGTGITKNYDYNPDARKNKTRVQKLHNLQAKLLRRALTEFPNVRRVLYSTCSMNPKENEEVIEEVLSLKTDFNLVDIARHFPSLSHGSASYPSGPKCISLSPEHDLTNGFFIALFERNGFEEPVDSSCFDTESHREIEIVAEYMNETVSDEMENEMESERSMSSYHSSDLSVYELRYNASDQHSNEEEVINLSDTSNDADSKPIQYSSSIMYTELTSYQQDLDSTITLTSSPTTPVPNENDDDDCVVIPLASSEGSFFDQGESVEPENLEVVVQNEAEEVDVVGGSEPDHLIASDLGFEDIPDLYQNGF